MMVIRRGEQLQQALRILQEVTEWSIAGQLARVDAGHLEEGEVARRLHQVGEILTPPPIVPESGTSDEDSSSGSGMRRLRRE